MKNEYPGRRHESHLMREKSRRGFSSAASAPSLKAQLDLVSTLIQNGKIISADKLVSEILKTSSGPTLLRYALTIYDLIGTLSQQNDILQKIYDTVQSTEGPLDERQLNEYGQLLTYLSNQSRILSASGLHSMAIKRAEAAVLVSRFWTSDRGAGSLLNQVKAASNAAGNVDAWVESTAEAEVFMENISRSNLVGLVESSAAYISIGYCAFILQTM
jgi:hypothetical protein